MTIAEAERLVRRIRACDGEAAGVALLASALREAVSARAGNSRVRDVIEGDEALLAAYRGMRPSATRYSFVVNTFRAACDVVMASERQGEDPIPLLLKTLAAADRRLGDYFEDSVRRFDREVGPKVVHDENL